MKPLAPEQQRFLTGALHASEQQGAVFDCREVAKAAGIAESQYNTVVTTIPEDLITLSYNDQGSLTPPGWDIAQRLDQGERQRAEAEEAKKRAVVERERLGKEAKACFEAGKFSRGWKGWKREERALLKWVWRQCGGDKQRNVRVYDYRQSSSRTNPEIDSLVQKLIDKGLLRHPTREPSELAKRLRFTGVDPTLVCVTPLGEKEIERLAQPLAFKVFHYVTSNPVLAALVVAAVLAVSGAIGAFIHASFPRSRPQAAPTPTPAPATTAPTTRA